MSQLEYNTCPFEMILFIGLQASGKSTFYQTQFASTHLHLSMDLWPNMRNRRRRLEAGLREALQQRQSVVLDNTNPTVEERAVYIHIAGEYSASIVGYYFESRMADCLQRNSLREGVARVRDVALFTTRSKLEMPYYREGFDQLFFVSIADKERDTLRFNVMEWEPEKNDHEQP